MTKSLIADSEEDADDKGGVYQRGDEAQELGGVELARWLVESGGGGASCSP